MIGGRQKREDTLIKISLACLLIETQINSESKNRERESFRGLVVG